MAEFIAETLPGRVPLKNPTRRQKRILTLCDFLATLQTLQSTWYTLTRACLQVHSGWSMPGKCTPVSACLACTR